MDHAGQSSLFNPLALDLLLDDVLPVGEEEAEPPPAEDKQDQGLVNKDVWDMLADASFSPSMEQRGTSKRDRRAASISSVCSEDGMPRQSFNLSPEDLAGAIDSMDLANLYEGGRGGPSSRPIKASLNSEDMNRLLQGGGGSGAVLSNISIPEPDAPAPSQACEPSARSSTADGGTSERNEEGRGRASSDQARPLWRAILMSIDDLNATLAVEDQGIAQKQAAISDFHQTMVPKLSALGEVGVLLRARLAMLMSDTGLIEGTAPPQSEHQLTNTALQALASLRRYAGNAMVAPIVMPRGSADSDATRKRQLSLGSGEMSALCSSVMHGVSTAAVAGDTPPGETPKLHACKNCQRAKTACMDQRPCPRCLRLGIPCDDDAKTVKRACANCKRAKVKCDLDSQDPCARCRRLGLNCIVHVPNKKKRASVLTTGEDDEAPSPRVTGGSYGGGSQRGSSFEPLSLGCFSGVSPVAADSSQLTQFFANGAPATAFTAGGGVAPPLSPLGPLQAVPAGLQAGGAPVGTGPFGAEGLGGLAGLVTPADTSLSSAEMLVSATAAGAAPELDSLGGFGGLGGLAEAQRQGSVPMETLGNLDEVCEQLLRSSTSSNVEAPAPIGEPPGPRLTQLLAAPPLLPVESVLQPAEWSLVLRDGNARLLKRATEDRRVLWATATDVPAPPALVAAGLRHVLRDWGGRDPLVQSVRVLSEGAEAPAWMDEATGASEQLLHATLAPPAARDYVLRAVWAVADGAHACSMRPAVAPEAPEAPGTHRGAVGADVWVLANPEEPGGAVLHAVLEPGDSAPLLVEGTGAQQLLEWTRRVQEAAIVLQRDAMGGLGSIG